MKHLRSDCDAIAQTIRDNPFESQEDTRRALLEIVEFSMAIALEIEKRDRRINKLAEDYEVMGDAVDDLLEGLSKNYLDAETGARIVGQLQGGMGLIVTLLSILEDEFKIDDIKKKQLRSAVEPHLQSTTALLAELEDIIDTEEEDEDGDTDDGEEDGGDPGGDGGSGGGDGDGDEDEDEGTAEEGT